MDPVRAVLVFVATVFFVLSPFVSGSFSGGFDPSLFPNPQMNPPAQPAGWAFSIWTVIYVWLLVSAGYGLFKRAKDTAWEAARLPLILSLAPGAAWLAVAQVTPVWSTALIIWMLVTAIRALLACPLQDRLWLRTPVALYAGWLTAAAWVAVALLGAGFGIGPGQIGWAVIALLGALGTGVAVQARLHATPEYSLPILWALIGISAANFGTNWLIVMVALLGGGALGVFAWRRR